MAKRDGVALRAQLKRILVGSFLVLALAGAAGAFAVGFSSFVSRSIDDPASAPMLRLDALNHLDGALGYGGFLKAYGVYLAGQNGADAELPRLVDEADASLGAYARTGLEDGARDEAAVLKALVAPFRRAALFSASAPGAKGDGLAPLPELERSYSLLKAEIARASETANLDRIRMLSGAFVWAQATSVTALWLLAGVMFALAWFVRERLITPLEVLRSSVNAAAAGAIATTVWGIDRDDEIGALARAAERLRQVAAHGNGKPFERLTERLSKGADRLEHQVDQISLAMGKARTSIEEASARTAKASQTAAEAAGLAREGAVRIVARAENTVEAASARAGAAADTLIKAVATLSVAAERLEPPAPVRGANGHAVDGSLDLKPPFLLVRSEDDARQGVAPLDEAGAVIEDLLGDLDALERFARQRTSIASDQAVVLTASLIDAIDRLNLVAERVSATADTGAIRAAE